jgi:PRTRC genetic system protein E
VFKELAPLARIAPVSLTLFDSGDGKLRVIITQKKSDDDDHVPLNLAVTGTPEELDAELPLAIAEGAAMPDKSVKEQVGDQVAAAKVVTEEADGDKVPKGSVAGSSFGKSKKTVKKPAKVKAVPRATAREKKALKANVRSPKTPKLTPLIKPAITPRIDQIADAKPHAIKPGKKSKDEKAADKRAACLADLETAVQKFGADVTRAQFKSMKPASGRSFESLWGSWDKFKEERAKPLITPNGDSRPAGADGQIDPLKTGPGTEHGAGGGESGPAAVPKTSEAAPAAAPAKTGAQLDIF